MTPTAAMYARECRRESRDALLFVTLLRPDPPADSYAVRQVVSYVWHKADRCRNGGVDLPKSLALKAVAERMDTDPSAVNWRAMISAASEAYAELDATIDYTRPA